jgi:hypothetical protein
LSVFLYLPLRSPTTPFGPNSITSWESFTRFVTAEGLRVNLFAFGLADQPARFSVFFNLLQLQYPPISIALAVVGWLSLLLEAIRKSQRRHPYAAMPTHRDASATKFPDRPLEGVEALAGIRNGARAVLALLSVFLLVLYVFVMNTIQDVMAYLLLPFMAIAILIGAGAHAALSVASHEARTPRFRRVFLALAAVALIGLPVATALPRAPRVSLRAYTAGTDWARRVTERFEGKGEGAFLLAPWEALTPLWVEQYTNNHTLEPRDVTLVYVAATSTTPFLDGVFAHFDLGPVYLADYRREIVEGGLFRLRPDGGSPPLWRVAAPGDLNVPPLQNALNANAEDQIEIIGYSLDRTTLRAGETAYLTLAMRAPITPARVLMPYALVGERAYRWTTDSRVLSTTWQPGEVIVERYEIALPFSTPPGEYPIRLGVTDLTEGRDLRLRKSPETSEVSSVTIGSLTVQPPYLPPDLAGQTVLADFGAQAALVGASASANGQTRRMESGAWTQPLAVRPGQSIQVWLDWSALQPPIDNYKVFVHLITPGEQLAAPPADFYTPLGGAFPTHLWIPKWIEGQRVSDPYTLALPPDIPPGEYRIQAGLYGLTSGRRVYAIGQDGSLAGDRVILGPVVVE